MTFLSPEDPAVREARRRNMIDAYNRQTMAVRHLPSPLVGEGDGRRPADEGACIPCAVLAVSLSVAIGMVIAFVLPAFF